MKLIVNIPAYNEQDKIGETIVRIKKSFNLDFYSREGSLITEKLIQVVNDGSTDKTEEMARNAGADIIINRPKKEIPRNTVGAAFKSGVDNALENGVDFFVNIDADGQFNPDDIPKLLPPVVNQTADIVVASPSDVAIFNDSARKAIFGASLAEPLPAAFPLESCPFTVTFYFNERPPAAPARGK